MATSIDSYRGRNWTNRLSAFTSLYSVAQPVINFSHVGGFQQKPLVPSAQPSPALETSEKNNSKIWTTT
jgi:hypothetical protein